MVTPRNVVTFFELKISGVQLSRDVDTAFAGALPLLAGALRGQVDPITEPQIKNMPVELPPSYPYLPDARWEPYLLTFDVINYVGEYFGLVDRYCEMEVYNNQRSGPAASENTRLGFSYEGYVTEITPIQKARGSSPKKLTVVMMVDHIESPIGADNDANARVYIDIAEQIHNTGGIDLMAQIRANVGFS